jgi:hypothetical protein
MGRSLHQKLKRIYEAWSSSRDDAAMLAAVAAMADEFSKERLASEPPAALRLEDLTLICFEHVTG